MRYMRTKASRTARESPSSSVKRSRSQSQDCLLYTSDAADERSSVDLGGRRIIKKKKNQYQSDDEDRDTKNKQTQRQ